MPEVLTCFTPTDEQAKALYQATDRLLAQADRLRQEVETYDRNLSQIRHRSQLPDFARLSDIERDRLRADLKACPTASTSSPA